ncbi:hypothetical protein JZ751_000293 [Albula glossodonta]|uniref:Uncharacterized protein n=1 Tax=Albula glossodonta TaxID=121402 RepID=A0A8T2PVU5_9TELE|nr:hypothetical protein JZ751_000293 [Albula glossodonta]
MNPGLVQSGHIKSTRQFKYLSIDCGMGSALIPLWHLVRIWARMAHLASSSWKQTSPSPVDLTEATLRTYWMGEQPLMSMIRASAPASSNICMSTWSQFQAALCRAVL